MLFPLIRGCVDLVASFRRIDTIRPQFFLGGPTPSRPPVAQRSPRERSFFLQVRKPGLFERWQNLGCPFNPFGSQYSVSPALIVLSGGLFYREDDCLGAMLRPEIGLQSGSAEEDRTLVADQLAVSTGTSTAVRCKNFLVSRVRGAL